MKPNQNELAAAFDEVHSGALYWTISLYIPAQHLSQALGLPQESSSEERQIVQPGTWRKLVSKHRCSLVLGNAMEPLFNDIADRDVQGTAQEFLVAADDDPAEISADPMKAAKMRVLDEIHLKFMPPPEVGWVTEGVNFVASPSGLSAPRDMTLKRFWFAHYGGALSYHLSFIYRYKPLEGEDPVLGDGYTAANYCFMSMLQKLVAPKEFALPYETLFGGSKAESGPGESFNEHIKRSVFSRDTGIALLDHPIVAGLAPSGASGSAAPTTFWQGIAARFNDDAQKLINRLEGCLALPAKPAPGTGKDWRSVLLQDQPVIEVPGLGMPPCRFEFFFHDKRFFDRLLPVDEQDNPMERNQVVLEEAYQPYAAKIRALRKSGHDPVPLDQDFWGWAGAKERSGCLDYLFLSGFNQNIIDFMNQDTSEILDSTDPLYPEGAGQQNERFFVRFANHRALVTFVPDSRSLEIGNDYIGTCPYAFLIHVLAMHNEFLDRLHETSTARRMAAIEALLAKGDKREGESVSKADILAGMNLAEKKINEAQLAHYYEYQKFRYLNPFRYDTERDVFEKLENLRGTSRKQLALQAALDSLEDHAKDLGFQVREIHKTKEEEYQRKVSITFSIIGLSSLVQMIYGVIGTKISSYGDHKEVVLFPFHTIDSLIAFERAISCLEILFAFFALAYLIALFVKDTWLRIAAIIVLGVVFGIFLCEPVAGFLDLKIPAQAPLPISAQTPSG